MAEIPMNTGMAFVIIQHLDAQHESQLIQLLRRSSRIPIDEAMDGTVLAPDHAYVIMPNSTLHIENGVLRTTTREVGTALHMCIDIFFRALALERNRKLLAVVLSGSGSDGTLGIAAIKAAGGMTFAQDESAEHAGMPHSAIGNGHVDFVLTPAEIAKEIAKMAEFGFPATGSTVSMTLKGEDGISEPDIGVDDPEHYDVIIGMLRVATGIDFTHYKTTTILRRTKRRMTMKRTSSLLDYSRILSEDPEELESLARDILIHVTGFYRDPAVFAALTTMVFPSFLKDRDLESPIRIWVVGCSTGQEVYSMAMELMEFLSAQSSPAKIQIFATDISDWALNKARIGLYPEGIADEIPADRIAKYFSKESSGYRILKPIRDLCVFAKHDVAADVPFSHIDLISCRNVLIYFGQVLQNRVLPIFHFSLRRSGHLLLGTSESIGQAYGLFEVVDEKCRLFRSIISTSRYSRPILQPSRPVHAGLSSSGLPAIITPSEMQRSADQLLLGRFAPASVLVTSELEIIQFRGRTQTYLENAQGSATLNILSMLPFGASEVLREAIAEAKSNEWPVRRNRVSFRRLSTFREIDIEVIPMNTHTESRSYLVIFEETADTKSSALADAGAEVDDRGGLRPSMMHDSENSDVILLRRQLAESIQHIQSLVHQNRSLVEQNSAQSDQLRVAQDESQSINEEFRSTNEELQSAKEEVESSNEELITINDELRAANEDIGKAASALRSSGDLTAAIVETMRYPLLVLDTRLMVVSANQAFLDAFHVVRDETLGQLVYELGNGQWNIPELRRLLEDLLPTNAAFDDFTVSHDFKDLGLRTMLLNARRLHDHDVAMRRIVLVIADITDQTRNTRELKELSAELMRSNAELDQFAAVASHDIQEPLRMISSYTALLQRRYDPIFDDAARQFMAHVTDGAQRMREMINGILLYSRLGHQATDKTDIDLSVILTNVMEILKVKVEEAQGTIIAGPLPIIYASTIQITQLLQNLLSNAFKFRSDKRSPIIHISAKESESEWTISVSDNGIGMEQSHFGKIFKLFQRLPTDRKIPGTGIGLATCKKIVEHHYGSIWVESKIDVGSTFSFTIPK